MLFSLESCSSLRYLSARIVSDLGEKNYFINWGLGFSKFRTRLRTVANHEISLGRPVQKADFRRFTFSRGNGLLA